MISPRNGVTDKSYRPRLEAEPKVTFWRVVMLTEQSKIAYNFEVIGCELRAGGAYGHPDSPDT